MSRRLRARIVLALLLLLGAGSGGYAFAHTDVLAAITAADLEPSAIPPMLDAIDESGRTGWECRPEKAAAATRAKDAALPEAATP
jgi:hypothetical protein